jgi:amino acid adenylation domain-containing protein
LGHLLLAATEHDPDRPAVSAPGGTLTYADLADHALSLTGELAGAGVRPGDRVVVWLPKSAELVTVVFGILLAGACYVPIDHRTPAGRARVILDDAEARAIVTERRRLRELAPDNGEDVHHRDVTEELASTAGRTTVVGVWERPGGGGIPALLTWSPGVGRPAPHRLPPVGPSDRAYILYTSGSTGRPKGVVHTHRSAAAFVSWAVRRLDLRADDVLSQHASASFDLSVFDFFASVAARARLALVPEWFFGHVGRTCRFIRDSGITVWYSVPSALLPDIPSPGWQLLSESALRHVVFAGETIAPAALAGFARWLPTGCAVHNWFGPTETNVCTHHEVTGGDLESRLPIPIGIPCPYASVWLAGSDGRAHPWGDCSDGAISETAELVVGGPSVMTGYWHRGTAGLVEVDGATSYHTGDMVRLRAGRLDFLGRRDRQVKLRGYRVQPEEVETVLVGDARVLSAAAVVVDRAGTPTLEAVVVTDADAPKLVSELRDRCTAALPTYMVPTRIVRIAAMPRGARGKVDLEAVVLALGGSADSQG